jgi:hypothetical protein
MTRSPAIWLLRAAVRRDRCCQLLQIRPPLPVPTAGEHTSVITSLSSNRLHLIQAPSCLEPCRFDAPGTHSCAQESLSIAEPKVEEDMAVWPFSSCGIL